MIKLIEDSVVSDCYTPAADKVLRFFELPLESAKIIIVGQDPYPQPGVATGRAFEVGNLISWDQPFRNISLKNILRAVYKAYRGEIITYSELKSKFRDEFPVLPPSQLFSYWESQGVLLLNTSFTCRPGSPGSHKNLWDEFTNRLLGYINDNTPDSTWFLWGNHARSATQHLQICNSISTMHPMMCYDDPGRDNDFLYGKKNCFEPFRDIIDWTGFEIAENAAKGPESLIID
ncbi:MAG: uracil-DNA glycosylase [Prolixibacteraceae bacterium]|nr:uracil-DNA glycosylase [Prolixibacteraceae bacterium]